MSDFINGAVFASVLILGSGGMVLFYMILHYEKAKIEWQRESNTGFLKLSIKIKAAAL